jgi:hypothetical protein
MPCLSSVFDTRQTSLEDTKIATPAADCPTVNILPLDLLSQKMMDGKPDDDTSEKLVLAIDIGTTYSGMSYWYVFKYFKEYRSHQ